MEQEVSKTATAANQEVSFTKPPVVKSITKNKNIILVILSIVIVLAGIGAGWLITGKSSGSAITSGGIVTGGDVKEAGSADESTFKDSAEGVLKSGGIGGEGTHHLERDGGSTQFVYLTSTVIDLDSFLDKKVKVWGQTMSAKKAGWLMDIGKLKVLD